VSVAAGEGFGCSVSLVLIKERWIDKHILLDPLANIDAETKFAEEIAKAVSVDELDRRSAIARSLGLRVAGERAGGNQQTLLSASSHRPAKVTYRTRRDGSLVALALEVHGEGHERQTIGADAVDATITALSRDGYVDEASLPENSLSEALESVRCKVHESSDELILPVLVLAFVDCRIAVRIIAGLLRETALPEGLTPCFRRGMHLRP
jgi:hypothetical protein